MKQWIKQALPQEHGSWAFVVEPLLIAAIAGGAGYAVSGLGFFLAFLAYRPFSIGIKDALKRKLYPRTVPSLISGTVLLLVGAILLVLPRNWPLIEGIAFLGCAFLLVNAFAGKRSVLREGVGALLASPAAILAAPYAAPLFIIRPLASVLSVRGVINRWDDAAISRWTSVFLGCALIPMAWLAFGGFGTRFAAYGVCALRSVYAATVRPQEVKAIKIGIAETLVALIVIVGWLLDAYLTQG